MSATGAAFALREWTGGPGGGPPLHVHHHDTEAWYVLEGTLRFRLADRTFDVAAGGCVFVPGGVAHTFNNPGPGDVRYLIVLTRRILDLIGALHEDITPDRVAAVYRDYDSELLE
ncbi:MAG: cupin domain-containing protein [Dehalococcoidia bacterium]